MKKTLLGTVIVLAFSMSLFASLGGGLNPPETLPDNFPQFQVPGHAEDMKTMREFFWMHYFWRPYSTMWDMWMPGSVLWAQNPKLDQYRDGIRESLRSRHFSDEGYVSTHQHRGLAHFHGWPFPLWTQVGGQGWHFSTEGIPFGEVFNVFPTGSLEGWKLEGLSGQNINEKKGLEVTVTDDHAVLTTPKMSVDSYVAPFIVLEWWNQNMPAGAKCYIEWKTKEQPEFRQERRMLFAPEPGSEAQRFTMVPIYKVPGWKEKTLTQIRVVFEKAAGAQITIQSIFTGVDSRHPINNFAYIEGCMDYAAWTGDLNFLRDQVNRMRLALHYAIEEFQVKKYNCVFVPWVGHDGTSGIRYDEQGNKVIRYGHGIGGNYYDLLPFGGKDCYATVYCYQTLRKMAELESLIRKYPQWNLHTGALSFEPNALLNLAANVKKTGTELFWNDKTGRFVSAVDINGKKWDYGFIFSSLEAMYYDFALDWQKREIMDWLEGKRIVEGDTSTGEDIYFWRFAPRCTTKRNLEYYTSVWSQPEILKWGDQVQDGGAVLAWSFHDIIERIKVNSAQNAWQRLEEILEWYREVQEEGGYRAYYSKPGRGTLQGGGTAGGLGMDEEFVETLLVPRIMTEGFLGLTAKIDGLRIEPRLPEDWPSLRVSNIAYQGSLLAVSANREGTIRVEILDTESRKLRLLFGYGNWKLTAVGPDGKMEKNVKTRPGEPLEIEIKKGATITLRLQ